MRRYRGLGFLERATWRGFLLLNLWSCVVQVPCETFIPSFPALYAGGWDAELACGRGQGPGVQLLPLLLTCWMSLSESLHLSLPLFLSCPLGCQLFPEKDPAFIPMQQRVDLTGLRHRKKFRNLLQHVWFLMLVRTGNFWQRDLKKVSGCGGSQKKRALNWHDAWRVKDNDNPEAEDHGGYIVSALATTQGFF